MSARNGGIRIVASELPARAARRLAGRARRMSRFAEELAFDVRFGVRTAGIVRPRNRDGEWLHAVHYQAVPAGLLREVLSALPIDPHAYTFVDLGAGKGKAAILASRLPFRSVLGVELAPHLAAIASGNVAKDRGARASGPVEVICADARSFAFPPGPLVVYLFNPFDEHVLVEVLASMRRSVEETPRRIILAYTCNVASRVRVVEATEGVRRIADLRHTYLFELTNKPPRS